MLDIFKKRIIRRFEELLISKDYTAMGWFFWNGFAESIGDSQMGELYSSLWETLTSKQKKQCENI